MVGRMLPSFIFKQTKMNMQGLQKPSITIDDFIYIGTWLERCIREDMEELRIVTDAL